MANVSQKEAWAVGARGTVDRTRALIERWDGTRWRIFPSPNVGKSVLNDIDARSSNDAWAVGERDSWYGNGPALIEHWDGRQWRVVADANPNQELELRRVSITPSGEVWAAGVTNYLRGPNCVEHWDGIRWRFVPLPAGAECFVWALDTLSSRDIWIETTAPHHRILHWDGTRWNVGAQLTDLTDDCCPVSAIAALSDRDVWAVGVQGNLDNLYYQFIAHWNGIRWRSVKAPQGLVAGTGSNAGLNDVSGVAGSEVWAAGDGPQGALVERYGCSA